MSTLRPETVVFLDATHLSVHFYKKIYYTLLCVPLYSTTQIICPSLILGPRSINSDYEKSKKNNFLTTCLTLPMAELYANLPKSSYEMCK